MPGSGDAMVMHYVFSMSTGRQGAAQDKLWQLEQELKGPSCLQMSPSPSVVQWHLLFKFTPAAVKCNTTRPLSQAAGVEAQRLWQKRRFRQNSRFCVFSILLVGQQLFRNPDVARCVIKVEKQLDWNWISRLLIIQNTGAHSAHRYILIIQITWNLTLNPFNYDSAFWNAVSDLHAHAQSCAFFYYLYRLSQLECHKYDSNARLLFLDLLANHLEKDALSFQVICQMSELFSVACHMLSFTPMSSPCVILSLIYLWVPGLKRFQITQTTMQEGPLMCNRKCSPAFGAFQWS